MLPVFLALAVPSAFAEFAPVAASTAPAAFERQLERAADLAGDGARLVFDGAGAVKGAFLVAQARVYGRTAAPAAKPAAPRPERAAEQARETLTVRPGDTLSALAAKSGMSAARLYALNPQIANPNLIHPGQVLKLSGVPSPRVPAEPGKSYRVRPGDTLWDLSRQSGVSVTAIAAANGVANPRLIYAGSVLHIPSRRASQPEPIQPPKDTPPVDRPGAQASREVMARARMVGNQINSTGGYRFDGRNDCYGFVRRAWNPVLAEQGRRPLPVSDFPSSDWKPITSWSQLRPGDVVATSAGHQWGPKWHGGLYQGMRDGRPMVYDATPSGDVSSHPNRVFGYYYAPTHAVLTGK